MQFKTVAISLFVAVAAASDDITSLVTQVPDCALTCLITGASDIGCTVTDYTCQCSKAAELQASAGPCIDAACSTADQETALTISQEICEAVGITADTTSVGSSSNSTATMTSGTSTATGTSSSSTAAVTAGAGRLEFGALAGAAALFAFAL
ncbi:hypothetical protein PFICI_06144 [Pestalotiopsis fici W106-1]|uniref:CFEM domain-containing protein n=1 Tax=Pestalotiopsis fici (strain W106-1 / CGMCC3.15140) TaxID=1229662 RepID=W3X6W3_PESFW|nr:uncharacterized protein PFICI_06144 [Pestalotiopsis fici W106-1]ETS81142.1 hypothetical protein PFICI_06144 [Pestalotiopsis fici W106-1]